MLKRCLCAFSFSILLFSCTTGGEPTPQDQAPVGAAQAVTILTPPATGLNPCTGWAGGLFGALATYTRDENTVSFHGGTWTVPIPVRPGQAISDVTFGVEAPTGNAGDPTTIRVGLYSNGNALAFANLTPFGMGAVVNGDIPFSPARIIAPGETLELEFSPMTSGGYALSDTKIDNAQAVVAANTRTRPTWPQIVFGAAGVQEAADPVRGATVVRKVPAADGIFLDIPFSESEKLTGFSLELYGDGAVDLTAQLIYGTRAGGMPVMGTPTVGNPIINVPATWTTYQFNLTNGPIDLSAHGQLQLQLTHWSATGTYYFGYLWPIFAPTSP